MKRFFPCALACLFATLLLTFRLVNLREFKK